MANMAELVDQVPEAAQRMWTSALQLRGKEFCFILNDTVRDDDEELADPMAVRRSNSAHRTCWQLTVRLLLGAGADKGDEPPVRERASAPSLPTRRYLRPWRRLGRKVSAVLCVWAALSAAGVPCDVILRCGRRWLWLPVLVRVEGEVDGPYRSGAQV